MDHRSGRVLVAVAAAAATAAAGVVATSATATAAPASSAAKAGAASIFGHQSFALRAPAAATRAATSSKMPLKFGGYPLRVRTLTNDVIGPLQLAVPGKRDVLVADAARSVILRIGQKKPVLGGPRPGEIAGVDVNARGDIAYTWSAYKTRATGLSIVRKGHRRVDVDLSGFEARYNPDKSVTYGVQNPSACVAEFLKKQGIPPSYRGLVDSHPYSVKAVPGGWVVADAAANDLILVDGRGRIRLATVMPRQGFTFTAATAAAAGLPACFAGVTYYFEAVPTDVELGPDGALYVSTLPGGPESPGLARGSIYRFTLKSHHLRRIAGGFSLATNLAVTPSGRVLVTELGAGRISTIHRGRPESVINLAGVVSVEFRDHAIYAGTLGPADAEGNPAGPGSVVKIDVRW